MNYKPLLLSFLTLFAFCAATAASTPDAQAAYDAGDFAQAAARYEQARLVHPNEPSVYFNLGNSLYREGQLERALANYTRALWEAPTDGEVLANLERTAAELDIAPPTVPGYRIPATVLTLRQWQLLFLTGFWLLFLTLILKQSIPRAHNLHRWLLPLWILCILLASAGMWGRSDARFADKGMILLPRTTVRYEPNPKAKEHFRLSHGSEVTILSSRGTWLRIQHRDLVGWIPTEHLAAYRAP